MEDRDLFKKIQGKYSLDMLFNIYNKDQTISTLSRKTWIVLGVLNGILMLTFLFFGNIFLSVIFVVLLIKSVYSISKIDNYMIGAREGIQSGFEYGQIYSNLEVLQSENRENALNLSLWYSIFKYDWEPDKETDEELFLLKQILDKELNLKKI